MTGSNGSGQLTDLPPDEQRRAAREMALADGTVTGTELAARFGMSERWGRKQVAEARAVEPAAARPQRHADPSGTPPTRADTKPRAAQKKAVAAQSEGVPTALVRLTVGAVAMVAVVAMVHSFVHTRDLAALAGSGAALAWTLPLAVDGLVVAGSTSLVVDHRLSRPGSPLAWVAVAVGLMSSMAANVVAVDPALIDLRVTRWVMAGYAPVACAISGHLLLRMPVRQRPA